MAEERLPSQARSRVRDVTALAPPDCSAKSCIRATESGQHRHIYMSCITVSDGWRQRAQSDPNSSRGGALQHGISWTSCLNGTATGTTWVKHERLERCYQGGVMPLTTQAFISTPPLESSLPQMWKKPIWYKEFVLVIVWCEVIIDNRCTISKP